jgi:hypothetical protein
MFWAKNLLTDPERLLKERLGFGVRTNPIEKGPQVIEGKRRAGPFWAVIPPC